MAAVPPDIARPPSVPISLRWLPDRVNAWLARHVDAVMVTVSDLAERIGAHGGRGMVLHEAPPDVEPSEPQRTTVVTRGAARARDR